MIRTLSERNPFTVWWTALQTALSGLSRIVFCNCLDYDVGIIAEIRINYGTVPERIRQRRFAFGEISSKFSPAVLHSHFNRFPHANI